MASSDEYYFDPTLNLNHHISDVEEWQFLTTKGRDIRPQDAIELDKPVSDVAQPPVLNDHETTPRERMINKGLSQSQSIFFRLPAEIRLQIYDEVLRVKSRRVKIKHKSHYPAAHQLRPSVLAILETCTRVLKEAEHLFYSVNHIVYRSDMYKCSFVNSITPYRLEPITEMTVSVIDSTETSFAFKDLARLPNLKTLYVERRQPLKRDSKPVSNALKAHVKELSALDRLAFVKPVVDTDVKQKEDGAKHLSCLEFQLRGLIDSRR